jgi:hypothetical protein
MCFAITARPVILLFIDSSGLSTISETKHAVASREKPLGQGKHKGRIEIG